jgi:cellulose synthase/poly-beta-1,6-N-acetylglucosamine synthase-like glycosyltransferase
MTLNPAENSNQQFFPKVSVVVPIYNGEADLPELLSCLQAQTYPTEQLEYLLVDNASCDSSANLLEIAATSGMIQVLQENDIQSSYAARNQGIRAATGEIIAFTDADCRPQPNWLSTLIAPFTDKSIGVVAGEIVAFRGKTWLEQHADRHHVLSQQHTLKHSYCPYGQTANLAIRRQIFEQVGLFRPYLTTGGDADICWRIQQETSWRLDFAPRAIVQHRHRATLGEYQKQWRRYGCSNRYLHQLHGVELMGELTRQEYWRRLGRWLVKELPISSWKAIANHAPTIDLIATPINLFGTWARAAGQREAVLPEKAREIEWLKKAIAKNEALDSIPFPNHQQEIKS